MKYLNKNYFKYIFQLSAWKDFFHHQKSLIEYIIKSKTFLFIISLLSNKIKEQEKDPLSIPVFIINYNRLADLKKLVTGLLEKNHKNIYIIDNNSSYPSLLKYYKEIENKVNVLEMDKNLGHLVFWKSKKIYSKVGVGYYIVTDSDIELNKNLPADYLLKMIRLLKEYKDITKVGFALRIDDIPETFKLKEKVIQWEKKYWKKEVEKDVYLAPVDTTFGLYRPCYRHNRYTFLKAVRVGGDYSARHGGWYMDLDNLTEEEKYYFRTANSSNSWKVDEDGALVETDLTKRYK